MPKFKPLPRTEISKTVFILGIDIQKSVVSDEQFTLLKQYIGTLSGVNTYLFFNMGLFERAIIEILSELHTDINLWQVLPYPNSKRIDSSIKNLLVSSFLSSKKQYVEFGDSIVYDFMTDNCAVFLTDYKDHSKDSAYSYAQSKSITIKIIGN